MNGPKIHSGSDHIIAGPLFDQLTEDISFMDAAYCGSRIAIEHLDSAPRVLDLMFFERKQHDERMQG